ncbi:MAG: sulfotransferase family 2 domain-containing protein [Anaerolineales bacterium]|nr:sulfotransferase family 2 domain-containing protein [Anaerolineales bacterium]
MKKLLLEIYNTLPEYITQPIDCRRRRNYWNASEIIFVHVPKAAGTSISHALYGRSLGHFKASEIKRYCPVEFSSLYKFTFVRNPWDRAVSAYRFALKGSTDTAGMRRPEQYNVPAFRSFEAFVYEWLADKELAKLDNVFQPQYLFVADDDGALMVDFLGKVESLDEDIIRLSAETGIKLDIPDLNRISAKGSYVESYKDKQLINVVGDLYAEDVALFGYDFK